MKFKVKHWWIMGLWLACFAVGAFAWKILHTGSFTYRGQPEIESIEDLDLSVYVGDYLITRSDIEWEYRFYQQQLAKLSSAEHHEGEPPQTLDPLPDSVPASPQPPKPNIELYNKILSDLIERKLLYQYIANDSHFNLDEPARFTTCIQDWQQAVAKDERFFADDRSRGQLKSMLCEKDILEQYIRERIMAPIQFSEQEIQGYYDAHKSEFFEPARVKIRQVLLASESDAKKAKARINSHNFGAIAKELSIAPEAQAEGELGPFAKGEMPELFDVAFEMNPGDIQGILKSTYGFHIIMLEKKLPKVQLSIEAVRKQIVQHLASKRQEEEYQKWVEMALNNIPIKSSRSF